MKIYCPINIPPLSNSTVYGWVCESPNDSFDIFIAAFHEMEGSADFKAIGIETCQELGKLQNSSSSSKSTSHLTFPLPNHPNSLISLKLEGVLFKRNLPSAPKTPIVIYYKIFKEFSKSADFSGPFGSTPLKQIKWASIINYNRNGQFLGLSPFQKFISSQCGRLLALSPVNTVYSLVSLISFRKFSQHSSALDQFFQRKDSLHKLYQLLLLGDFAISDSSRLNYRNGLLLSTSDLLLGSITGILFSYYVDAVLDEGFSLLENFASNFFEEYLDWFMGWPAGFKLNANLTKFIGKFFLALLRIWKVLVFPYLSNDLVLLRIVLNFKNFGLSMILGLLQDFWSICTLHIFSFYQLIRPIYAAYVAGMVSFLRLFQGRKWNVLRNRVDKYDFTMDQHLVGMLFFSILFCTFPTIVAYYGLFLTAYTFVLVVGCVVKTLLLTLNQFPIYSTILRLASDPILVEGIKLSPFNISSRTPSFKLHLELSSWGHLFTEFWRNVMGIWSRPFNFENLKRALCGHEIET